MVGVAHSASEDALTDEDLIRRTARGDNAAFDKLMTRYQEKVYNFCYRFLGDREEANDCAQDIFVKAFKSARKFRFQSKFSTWLYRIAANTCKNRTTSSYYRHSRQTLSVAGQEEQVSFSETTGIGDRELSPRDALEKKEARERIQTAINTLPAEQKEVVILRDIQGFSYEDIARITGRSPGTIKSRLARARGRLRNVLGKE